MSVHTLRSTNIFLHFDYNLDPWTAVGLNQIWRTLKGTTVECGQSLSPDLVSFADECLLCAQIAPNFDSEEGDGAPSAATPATGGHTRPLPVIPATESLYPPPPKDRCVGLIYLHASPANPPGEANIGVIMKPTMQHRGYAREAVQLLLGWAFEGLHLHRVQAAILDTPFRDSALRLFIGSGFVHEGTKRRAVYQPEGEGMAASWKDVTYLAILDTEWMLRSMWERNNQAQERPAVTLWDEMFTRHAREREELVRWEEKHGRMGRPSSMETLKENMIIAPENLAYLTDDASSVGGESSVGGSPPSSPGPNITVIWDDDSSAQMEDHLSGYDGLHQRWLAVTESTIAMRRRQDMASASLQLPPLDRVLSLPSIPSTRISNGNPQSPVTIWSSSTPGSTPPSSPSPAPSIYTSLPDSEDEDNWLLDQTSVLPTQVAIPHGSYPFARSRSSSVFSSSSSNSWSDAQSSVGTWDIVSDMSDPNCL